MKFSQALIAGLIGLSTVSLGIPSFAQTSPGNGSPTESEAQENPFSQEEIDEHCANIDSEPEAGVQFDGVAVSPEVTQLSPGLYQYPNRGALVLFPNSHYFLQTATNEVSATSGPDLVITPGGVLGGCSIEQLSEALAENSMNVEAFEPVNSDNGDRAYGKEDIDQFCEEPERSTPQPGIQFDGEAASPEVMALATGRYEYPNEGVLLYFANKHFLLRLPKMEEGDVMYGTDGDDLFDTSGLVGGCSPEQLSEALVKNGISVDSLEFTKPYD